MYCLKPLSAQRVISSCPSSVSSSGSNAAQVDWCQNVSFLVSNLDSPVLHDERKWRILGKWVQCHVQVNAWKSKLQGASPGLLWMLIKFRGSVPALWSVMPRVILQTFYRQLYVKGKAVFQWANIRARDKVCDKKMQFYMMLCRGVWIEVKSLCGNIFCVKTPHAVLTQQTRHKYF